MPSIKIFVSLAVPPRTNNPSLSPTCCAPGNVFNAPVTSPSALAVVTISIGFKTVTALFLSLASNVPAEITTAESSVTSSLRLTSRVIVLLGN